MSKMGSPDTSIAAMPGARRRAARAFYLSMKKAGRAFYLSMKKAGCAFYLSMKKAGCARRRAARAWCLSREKALAGALFALLVGALLSAVSMPARAADYPSLFGSSEIRGDNLAMFAKWRGMLDRMRQTPEPFEDACEQPQARLCHLKEWNAFLRSLEGLSAAAQLDTLNRFMNKFPYIEDIVNWGFPDYWEVPLEFLHKSGDCKDYAIAKYMSLRFLGFPIESLRVAVVQDLNLRVAHAVLVVYQDGQALVLDNQISHVISARSIRHYRPIYSLNERHWWLHRG